MIYDYSKLKGKIVEVYGKKENFYNELKMTYRTFYRKITCENDFTQSEIIEICSLLGIEDSEIQEYFFKRKAV